MLGKTWLTLVFAPFVLLSAHAQETDWPHRHAFAKSYYGLGWSAVPAMADGVLTSPTGTIGFGRSGFFSPAVNIGATHFWGHADFYVSIHTVPLKWEDDAVTNRISMGTFTGLRAYPWAVGEGEGIRPFVGYKFSPWRYRQGDVPEQQVKVTRIKGMVDAGLGWETRHGYFTLEACKVLRPEFTLHTSRTSGPIADRWPGWFVQMGLNFSIETTATASTPVNLHLNETLPNSNRDGFFLAAGPSSAFPVVSSPGVTEVHPFLDDLSFPTIFPDVALGWHFTKTDAVVAVSRRSMTQRRAAYGIEQTITRTSHILEAYKFLGDYHGFAPYLGLGVSTEDIAISESDQGIQTGVSSASPHPVSIVFGWDIRPSEKGDWWVLRTNLRIPPSLTVDHEGKTLSLQHLEFNFIQLVVYPQRLRRALQWQKNR